MPTPLPLLAVDGLTKRFTPNGLAVVDALTFDVRPGELFALLGPSGCGKTTALRLVAGFEQPDAGTLSLDGAPLASDRAFVPPERRGIGLVFQDYALFPHLSVAANVGFGLRTGAKADRQARVRDVLKLVGLTGFEDRAPHQLSGGQQQRVALARALAPRPPLLLLDEPFSNLDALLRAEMRRDVRAWLQREGTTAILVTHDQEEAMTFADRVAVMQGGRIEQVGTPEEVYHRPRTLFVAQFLGQTNLVLTEAHGREADSVLGHLTLHREAEGMVLVALRPEHLSLTPAPETAHCREGTVTHRDFRGHDITYRVQLGPVDCLVHTDNRHPFAVGDTVYVRPLDAAVVLEKAGR